MVLVYWFKSLGKRNDTFLADLPPADIREKKTTIIEEWNQTTQNNHTELLIIQH